MPLATARPAYRKAAGLNIVHKDASFGGIITA